MKAAGTCPMADCIIREGHADLHMDAEGRRFTERCPDGCGCEPGQADMRDCACDGPCVFDDAWRDLNSGSPTGEPVIAKSTESEL